MLRPAAYYWHKTQQDYYKYWQAIHHFQASRPNPKLFHNRQEPNPASDGDDK